MKSKMPLARRVFKEEESRVVVHTVVRDLIRVLSKRKGLAMNRVVWEALQQYWLSNGYTRAELINITEPESCPN